MPLNDSVYSVRLWEMSLKTIRVRDGCKMLIDQHKRRLMICSCSWIKINFNKVSSSPFKNFARLGQFYDEWVVGGDEWCFEEPTEFCVEIINNYSSCSMASESIAHEAIGVRGGGARGAAALPNFGQLRFFGQQEKIWAKPFFKGVSVFFYYFKETNVFYFNLKKSWSQRNNPVTFSRDTHSGCLARDEFLVIGKGIICWFTNL